MFIYIWLAFITSILFYPSCRRMFEKDGNKNPKIVALTLILISIFFPIAWIYALYILFVILKLKKG